MNFREWFLIECLFLETRWDDVEEMYQAYKASPTPDAEAELLMAVEKLASGWARHKTDKVAPEDFAQDVVMDFMTIIRKQEIETAIGLLKKMMSNRLYQIIHSTEIKTRGLGGLKNKLISKNDLEDDEFSTQHQGRTGSVVARRQKDTISMEDIIDYVKVLKPEHQEVVRLIVQGLKLREVGEVLGRNVPTMKQWFYQIRRWVQIAKLSDEGSTPEEILEKTRDLFDKDVNINDIHRMLETIQKRRRGGIEKVWHPTPATKQELKPEMPKPEPPKPEVKPDVSKPIQQKFNLGDQGGPQASFGW